MTITVVGVKWPPETFIARLLQGLAERGVTCIVMVDRLRMRRSRTPHAGILLRWQPSPGSGIAGMISAAAHAASRFPLHARRAVQLWRAARHMRSDLRGRLFTFLRCFGTSIVRTDVLYFPWNATAVELEPLLHLGVPTIISCRGAQVNIAPLNPRRGHMVDGLRRTFTLATRVHCVSDAIAHEAERYGLAARKVRVIRPAVDPRMFRPADSAGEPSVFRIVTTGSLIWRKSLEDAIQVVRMLQNRGRRVHLTIIGDGPERQRLLFAMHDMGVADRVTLAGSLPPAQVLCELQQAQAFVLTSVSEGISNAVLEAMASGVPVVSTDCGGMREVIRDGVNGFIVPMRDPESMASAIERLMDSTELCVAMGTAARATIVQLHALDEQIDAWMELIADTAKA